jgi:hypothetical protein
MINIPKSEINEIVTGPYADYGSLSRYDLVTCSWMGLHSDNGYGASRSDQYFAIKIHWVKQPKDSFDAPCLVHTDYNGNRVFNRMYKGIIYSFNAYKKHGLVPFYAVNMFLQSGKFPSKYNKRFSESTKPQIIFKFMEERYET